VALLLADEFAEGIMIKAWRFVQWLSCGNSREGRRSGLVGAVEVRNRVVAGCMRERVPLERTLRLVGL
jgi:hypothetical protein